MAFLDDISIRPLTSADIPAIRKLHSSLLPIVYPLSFYLQLLLHPSRICLLAHPHDSPKTPIAFISASITPPSLCRRSGITATYTPVPTSSVSRVDIKCNEPRVHILTLGVLPKHQRAGLARELVVQAVRKLREAYDSDPASQTRSRSPSRDGTLVTAHISATNTAAQKLYQVLGLEPNGHIVPDVYRTLSGTARDARLLVGRVASS